MVERVAWVDASAGASGDLLLGALVDAGVPIGVLAEAVEKVAAGDLYEERVQPRRRRSHLLPGRRRGHRGAAQLA